MIIKIENSAFSAEISTKGAELQNLIRKTDNIVENEITYGQPVGDLPEVSKPGYDFEGWEDQNNNQITE